MKKLLLLFTALTLITSCNIKKENVEYKPKSEPLVDITNAEKSVHFLCDLLTQLNNPELSDDTYREIQIKIEAVYLGIQFGLNAGFYTENELLTLSESLECLM